MVVAACDADSYLELVVAVGALFDADLVDGIAEIVEPMEVEAIRHRSSGRILSSRWSWSQSSCSICGEAFRRVKVRLDVVDRSCAAGDVEESTGDVLNQDLEVVASLAVGQAWVDG